MSKSFKYIKARRPKMEPVSTYAQNANDYIINVYVVYSILSIILISWLAVTLYRNGSHFLAVVFRDNTKLAKAVNHLLVTGFIMFSLGFASLTVAGGKAQTVAEAFEASTKKFGILLVVLAFAHLFNMLVLNNMRKTAERKYSEDDKVGMKTAYEKALDQYNVAIAKNATSGEPFSG